MKTLALILLVLLGLLQYKLWYGKSIESEITHYETRIAELEQLAEQRRLRNRVLEADVVDLKTGQEAIEERARRNLGMIKKGETFVQVVEE